MKFHCIYNHFTNNGTEKNITIDSPLPKIKNFFPTRDRIGREINTDKTIKDVQGASADTRGGKDNVLATIPKFNRTANDDVPVILTLASVSSRPQNVAFEYEWTLFGFDRNAYRTGGQLNRRTEHRYEKITGRTGTDGNIIIQGEAAGTLTAKGTDKKQITIEIYGGDVRLGVALRISRPAADLESSVALPHAIFIQ